MKKILITSIIICGILLAALTYIGIEIKNKTKPYKEIEEKLELAAQGYMGEYLNELQSNNIILKSDKLIEMEYLEKLDYNCIGYVDVKQKMSIYEYKPYIKCDNYKTRDFDENKLK